MNNFWITVGHTVSRRLKSKAFMWSTLAMVLLIIGLMNAGQFISVFADDEEEDAAQRIAVVDETADDAIGESLVDYEEGSFEYVNYTEGDEEDAIAAAENGEYEYVLALSGDAVDLNVDFYGDDNDFMVGQEVNQDVQNVKEAVVTSELDLDEDELEMIHAPISFNEEPLSPGGEVQTEESQMQAYWMVYVLVIAIYMIVITFGTMIATEVATEKSSRVMELIVSSVNPITQMLGKLVGIGVVGLVSLAALAAAAGIGLTMTDDELLQMIVGEVPDVSLLLYALLFVVLGYFLYGGLAAMLGALVSRAEEVNQALQPLIIVAMIAFFIAIFGLNQPDTTFIQVMSYIPFFAPQLLFLRIGMGTVPMWEVAVIIGILSLSAILFNILAARIYKGGVLMYGKFSFKNGIKQAVTMSKKEKNQQG
ncbi:ABC transporter permease [Natribacillus halophilus]|uniref:ABC-2 type transport system permease protein n=1 Tax=Natribacillus halophilus TaxID=549003 RepID=A0A1G8NKH7_9BACI|nr:ABC transporter permease [Natribacillus halophilus]SDI80652.1 ABC-2 type transport system permease protein [Natribacillus halophilus]